MPYPLLDNQNQRPVVLVVDDAPDSLGMLHETLESAGYTVLVAADGDIALQRLQLITPDAILLDAIMPGISGFETCRRIKADPCSQHIPVIFMTGLSETSDVLEGFACGGVDYVVKPLHPPEVLARLHTHLGNARAVRSARDAIDASGLGVVMLTGDGQIAWCSPYAAQLLAQFDIDANSASLPASWWSLGTEEKLIAPAGESSMTKLLVRNMGEVGADEIMLLIEFHNHNNTLPGERLASAALTPRETEVLSWLAKGKTNRDIGEILELSPRTVSKHLEHVFEKLGVETRAAAVAMASGQQGLDIRS